MVDWQGLMLDPIYGTLGVEGRLTTASNVYDLTVMDKTSGLAALLADNTITIQTIRALAAVRVAELTSKNVEREALKDSTITFNSSTWTIHSTRPAPTPAGEAAGELYLLLEEKS